MEICRVLKKKNHNPKSPRAGVSKDKNLRDIETDLRVHSDENVSQGYVFMEYKIMIIMGEILFQRRVNRKCHRQNF